MRTIAIRRLAMRRLAWLFLLLWVACGVASGQPGENSGSVAVIRALEREWSVGQSRSDTRVLDLIFDNGLIYVEYGKLVSKGEYLARIKHEDPQLDQVILEGVSVHTFGTTALAVGTYREKNSRNGGAESIRHRFIDTWVYENGRWMLVAAAAAPIIK